MKHRTRGKGGRGRRPQRKKITQMRHWCKCGDGPFTPHSLVLHRSKVHGINAQKGKWK